MSAHRWMVGLAAAALFVLAGAVARADEAFALLEEGRFVDYCLEDPRTAYTLYEKVLTLSPTGVVEGEALYGRARCLHALGRTGPAERELEALTERRHERALGPWGMRAHKTLERAVAGAPNPFELPPRGLGEVKLRATAKPLQTVLDDIRLATKVDLAIDPRLPDPWTVSVDLPAMPVAQALDRLLGAGHHKQVAHGVYFIGPGAADGPAWQRPVPYAALKDPRSRAIAGRLRTIRLDLALPGEHVLDVLDKLRKASGLKIELAPQAIDAASAGKIRLFATGLELDHVLDLVAVSMDLAWVIEGDAVRLVPRKRPG